MGKPVRGKSITLNYLLNTSYQVLILIVPLITTPYISRVLGADGVGIYSYTYSIISYFLIVAAMGTSTYGQRTIAFYQDDKYNCSRKFYEILIFRVVMTAACCVGYVVYLITDLCKYNDIATIQIIWLIAVAFDVSWLFQGLEDFKKIVFRNTIAKIFNIILIFAFVKSEKDVAIYTVILSGMTLFANLSTWPYVPKLIQKVRIQDIKPFSNFKEIFLLFIPTIAVQINAVLDKTMIGGFAIGAAENGYYEQTEKVVRMALAIVTSLGTVMIPRISKLYHDKNDSQMKAYIEKSYQFVWLIGIPIMLGLISVTNIFVPVFYGEGYDRIKVLMPIYSLCVLPVALSNVTGCQFLIPTKKQNIYSIAVITSAIVNAILNSIMIPLYLADGAAAASVIAECVGCLIMLWYVQKRKLVDVRHMMCISLKKWIAGVVMFCCVKLTSIFLGASTMSLVFLIFEGACVYFIALYIIRDEFFHYVVKKVLMKVLKENIKSNTE